MTADGTKYVSSVRQGTVSRIRPGAEGRDHRLGHPERGVDDLRLEAQPAGDPDERLERHRDRRARHEVIGSRQRQERPGAAVVEAGTNELYDRRIVKSFENLIPLLRARPG